ncbi:SDR family oxidoreductase [Nonomuraea sp. NPDC050202]|uniref:SDR family oxidoreductase n=1 Tax=Nonomuraea sp. NPDC050202 TaxID=3155035 RepID=UPI0033CF2B78
MNDQQQGNPAAGDRVAVVTGGSGGIGQAVCRRLADDGYAVVIGYAGRPAEAEALAKTIIDGGGRAVAARADVGDEEEVAALFGTAVSAFGGVDVVVNTAGIMVLAPVAELDLAVLDRMHRINIRGTFVVGREAARRVRSGGAIINFSSSMVKIALPSYAAYAASKGAVDALTLILARELRGRDITVNAVAPGPTATPLFLDGKDQASIDRLAGMAPLERLGVPADIAEVVAFLAGPARWVNGQVLYANGGVV